MLQRVCVVWSKSETEEGAEKVRQRGKSEKTLLAWLGVSMAPLEACS